MHTGTVLVLIGTIICAIGVILSLVKGPSSLRASTVIGLGAGLIGLGVLIGAPKLS